MPNRSREMVVPLHPCEAPFEVPCPGLGPPERKRCVESFGAGPEEGHTHGQKAEAPLLQRHLGLFSLEREGSRETSLWPSNIVCIDRVASSYVLNSALACFKLPVVGDCPAL